MFNSVIENGITTISFLTCLGTAIVLGVLTSLVFQYKTRHTSSFSLTLSLLPMVVAVVIMLVNGNIGTGIAVAGAFALIRFRSVPGTAREISAIFVAMTIGLALGMGYVGIAAVFFALSAVLTLILSKIDFGGLSRQCKQIKITIPENFDYGTLFDEIFDKYTSHHKLLKVKTSNMGTLFELTYEITLKGESVPKEFIDDLRSRNGNLCISVEDFSDRETL